MSDDAQAEGASPQEPPQTWDDFADLVDRSLHEEITDQELVWLRAPENVVAWLTHLRYRRLRVENDIGTERRELADLRPRQQGMTPAAYLSAKRQFDIRAADRLREIHRIDRDLEEARYCAGYYVISTATSGYVIDRLTRIGMRLEEGLDDAVEATLEMLEALIDIIQRSLPGQPADEEDEEA